MTDKLSRVGRRRHTCAMISAVALGDRAAMAGSVATKTLSQGRIISLIVTAYVRLWRPGWHKWRCQRRFASNEASAVIPF